MKFKVGDMIWFTNLSGDVMRGAGTRTVTAVRDDGAVQLDNSIRAEGFGHKVRWFDTERMVLCPSPSGI